MYKTKVKSDWRGILVQFYLFDCFLYWWQWTRHSNRTTTYPRRDLEILSQPNLPLNSFVRITTSRQAL